ncbi:hypothetical protein FRB94_005523 [Tulasnella sp. JGI-2019a]|nr:hypothetical protein FRB94_005523 [Tulasnella sp. JGI-2019a]KAG9038279.1 hypothetical protein FRB95_002240 [Tulasnella sp. JGI-2019a]
MVPIAILAYAVYLGLKLSQGYLSHEKHKVLAEERIALLEEEVREWRLKQETALTSAAKTSPTGAGVDTPTDPQVDGQSKRWWSFGLI